MNIQELSDFIKKELEGCLPGTTDPDDPMYRVGYRDALNTILDKIKEDTGATPKNNCVVTEGYLGRV